MMGNNSSGATACIQNVLHDALTKQWARLVLFYVKVILWVPWDLVAYMLQAERVGELCDIILLD